MPLKKLPDDADEWILIDSHICKSSEHNPPTMIVLEPGKYEYVCPQCGFVQIFYVNKNYSL